MVVDEVFTAYGRCGAMFACEREDVTPDILVSSKGLSGGYVPIAAMSVRDRVYESFADEPVVHGIRYGHTTSGHAIACAAALATLDVLARDGLAQRAERLGGVLLDRLAGLPDQAAAVLDVRRLGLIVVVELSDEAQANAVLVRARDRGLLLRRQGNAVLLVPPLVIDDEGIEELVERGLPALSGCC